MTKYILLISMLFVGACSNGAMEDVESDAAPPPPVDAGPDTFVALFSPCTFDGGTDGGESCPVGYVCMDVHTGDAEHNIRDVFMLCSYDRYTFDCPICEDMGGLCSCPIGEDCSFDPDAGPAVPEVCAPHHDGGLR